MTKTIIIPGGSLSSYYEATLDYLHQRYQDYPDNPLVKKSQQAKPAAKNWQCIHCDTANHADALYCGEKYARTTGCGAPRPNETLQ
jgi:hypothetical protein